MQLNLSQTRAVDNLTKWFYASDSSKIAILEAPAGFGKAQPLESKILTPTGWKTMGEINKGDYVTSEEGNFIEVLETYPQTNLEMYELTFSDGSKVRCCKDHLWEIQTTDMRKRGTFKVMSLKDMLPKIQLEKTRKDTYTYSVRLPKPINFREQELPDMYDLGYTLGNGHSSKQLVVTVGVQDYLEILSYFNPSNILSHKQKDNSVAIISLTMDFRRQYELLGLQGKLAGVKHIPEKCFIASIEQRKDLLAGLLDSDGTCSKNKAKFDTTSYQLAKDVQQLVRSLGGVANIGKARENEFFVLLRTPFNPFRLARKAASYTVRSLDITANKRIVSATYVGVMDGKCILVDSKKHLYVTDDYTVTHNTFLVKYFIKQLGRFAKPLATAPFNEATWQLKYSLGNLNVPCKTTFSAFNFVEAGEEGEKEFKQLSPPNFENTNLIIIDEASTLSPELLTIVEATEGIKVLALGDPDQLPYVEKNLGKFDKSVSPIFTKGYPTLTLTQPMRNDSEIFTFARECAKLIHTRGNYSTRFNKSTAYLKEYLQKDSEKLLCEKSKILAYSNAKVDYWNKQIRLAIFKEAGEEDFLIHDKIVCINPSFGFARPLIGNLTLPAILSSKVEKVNCFTNTKADITKVSFREVLGVICYELSIDSDSIDYNSHVIIYVPCSLDEYKDVLHKYYQRALYSHASAKAANWRQYKQLQMVFANVKHSYAMTVHRSQGSTIPEVFVDWNDLDKCQCIDVRKKLRYVGSSRARDELYILI